MGPEKGRFRMTISQDIGTFKLLRPHWMIVLVIVALQVLGVYAQVESINLLKPILDVATSSDNLDLLFSLGMLLLLMTAIMSVVMAVTAYLASRVASAVGEELRVKIMEAALSMNRLDDLGCSSTDTMTALTNNVSFVQRFVFDFLRTYLPMPILMVALIYYSASSNTVIGMLMVGTLLPLIAITYYLSSRIFPFYMEQIKCMDGVNSSLREKVTGARTIRAYNGYELEEEKFAVRSTNLGKANTTVDTNSYFIPYLATAFMWMFIVTVYLVAILDPGESILPSEVIIFMQYATYLVTTLSVVPYLCMNLPKANICFSHINSILQAAARQKKEDRSAQPVQGTDTAISASGLVVKDRLGRRAIDNMDLSVPVGETVTILGPSGCGVSELFRAALGFVRNDAGSITVNGMDVSKAPLQNVRGSVSYASNRMSLFRGTLRYNFDPRSEHTDDEIMYICRRIGLSSLIARMPGGLDAEIGGEAEAMSGGQRLLIIIARCLLHDTGLYVFDDCFFSLDPATRDKAIETITDVCKGKTVVFVMHDTSTVEISDRIILISNGRKVDEGSHEDLLGRSALYRDLNSTGQRRAGSWA